MKAQYIVTRETYSFWGYRTGLTTTDPKTLSELVYYYRHRLQRGENARIQLGKATPIQQKPRNINSLIKNLQRSDEYNEIRSSYTATEFKGV